jgi:hypothetical protein
VDAEGARHRDPAIRAEPSAEPLLEPPVRAPRAGVPELREELLPVLEVDEQECHAADRHVLPLSEQLSREQVSKVGERHGRRGRHAVLAGAGHLNADHLLVVRAIREHEGDLTRTDDARARIGHVLTNLDLASMEKAGGARREVPGARPA